LYDDSYLPKSYHHSQFVHFSFCYFLIQFFRNVVLLPRETLPIIIRDEHYISHISSSSNQTNSSHHHHPQEHVVTNYSQLIGNSNYMSSSNSRRRAIEEEEKKKRRKYLCFFKLRFFQQFFHLSFLDLGVVPLEELTRFEVPVLNNNPTSHPITKVFIFHISLI